MKKGIIVTAIILSFFIIAIKSNADMKITPSRITSPDDSAALHLGGNFATRSFLPAPLGAVISGVNSYSSSYYSCGGYFKAFGSIGVGIYGHASNTGNVHNYGGYFEASGKYGDGVFGSCLGTNCTGVRGEASYSGNTANFGGIFEASGTSGIGVQGRCLGTYGKGVEALASGASGIGVYSVGGLWAFYAYGSGGNYGPFTGAHEVTFAGNIPGEIVPGMIVSVTGKTVARTDENGEISLSSTLPTVAISTRAKDKAVFGVIVSEGPLPKGHWYEAEKGERFGVVNALGEGRVWVTDVNGKIQAGDYITTSSVPGYGQIQDDDLMHSYTLGKAIETVDFDQVNATISHNGKMYKAYLLAVVYTSG